VFFTPDDIQARLREKPFCPFQILATSGLRYSVLHPEMVLVARRFVVVGTPSVEDPTLAESVSRIALAHIAELRDIPTSSPFDE
jgi:hypothetical protein